VLGKDRQRGGEESKSRRETVPLQYRPEKKKERIVKKEGKELDVKTEKAPVGKRMSMAVGKKSTFGGGILDGEHWGKKCNGRHSMPSESTWGGESSLACYLVVEKTQKNSHGKRGGERQQEKRAIEKKKQPGEKRKPVFLSTGGPWTSREGRKGWVKKRKGKPTKKACLIGVPYREREP